MSFKCRTLTDNACITESKPSIRNPSYKEGLVNFAAELPMRPERSQSQGHLQLPGENQGTCQELVSHKAGIPSSQQGTLLGRKALDEFVVLRVQL